MYSISSKTCFFCCVVLFVLIGFAEGTEQDRKKNKLPEFSGKTFVYQDITGIGFEKNMTRRDPSDVIKVGESYYVWYTKVDQSKLPQKFQPLRTSGYRLTKAA